VRTSIARRLLTALLAATAVFGLSSCAVGEPSGFTARSNHTCAQARDEISALSAPTDPKSALSWAIERYTAMDKVVSTLTDAPLPAGAKGAALRAGWLRPARASLRTGRDQLDRLRSAVQRKPPSPDAPAAFAASAAAGTGGVDLRLLQSSGLTTCATVFQAAPPAVSWAPLS
jgi:hypothetical protein